MVARDTLLQVLPPYQGNNRMVSKEQTLGDIKRLMKRVHLKYEPDYDLIEGYFTDTAGLEKELFDFVQGNIAYDLQTGKFQSVDSPAAILALGKGDCKHYASFIAGVLDAKNRAGKGPINWMFRYGGYNNGDIGHVFVVVQQGLREIWIDPAPMLDDDGGRTERYYNDRMTIPTKKQNQKILGSMALYEVSGPGVPSIKTTTIVKRSAVSGSQSNCGCNATMGKIDASNSDVEQVYYLQQNGGRAPVDSIPPTYQLNTYSETAPAPGADKPAAEEKKGFWNTLVDLAKANPVPAAIVGGLAIWGIVEVVKTKK